MSNLQNLNVPFAIPIPGGLQPGKIVVVQGTIPPMSLSFEINLITQSGDIALHISPKFRENKVVRNHVEHMMWGKEESNGSMPVSPGQDFEVTIFCEPFDFKVAFNGRHFTEFKHRSAFSTITELGVDGQVVVNNVNFKEASNYDKDNYSKSSQGIQAGTTSNYSSGGGLYPSNITEHFSNTDGPKKPASSTLYPTEPGFGNIPNKGPSYPQLPNPQSGGFNPPPGFYPPQSGGGGGGAYNPQPPYNPQAGGYSPQPDRYSPQPGFNPQAGGYSPQPGRYSPQPGYNPQPGGYGPQPGGYGPQPGGYNPQPGGYNSHSGGYNPQPSGHNSHSGGQNSTSHSKPGFLTQAGMALAGVLGPTLLAGALNKMSKKSNTQGNGKSPLMDQAGRALAGIFGGSGFSGTGHHKHNKLGVLGGTLGTAIAGAALTGHLNPKKALKKQRKAQKKALKYGLPIAGVGLGAYALHKGLHKGFHRSSSSSSCSSSD